MLANHDITEISTEECSKGFNHLQLWQELLPRQSALARLPEHPWMFLARLLEGLTFEPRQWRFLRCSPRDCFMKRQFRYLSVHMIWYMKYIFITIFYLQIIVYEPVTISSHYNIIVIHWNDHCVIPFVDIHCSGLALFYDVRAHVSIFALEQCDDLFVNICLTFLARHVILFAKGPSSLHEIFQSLMREMIEDSA